MSDQFDRASDIEQAQREAALQAQRSQTSANAGKTWMDSAKECRVCDEPIPLKRRKALPGVNTCVECQTDLERAIAGRARN